MLQAIETKGKSGKKMFNIYSRKDIEDAWKYAYSEAIQRKRRCVETLATKQQAIELSALFVRTQFADRYCTHWDGTTLSLYCGRKWGGDVDRTVNKTKEMVSLYFKEGLPTLRTALFEEDVPIV